MYVLTGGRLRMSDDSLANKLTLLRKKRLFLLFAAIGPGIMVMLADTDAGSIITAAQSGAMWGYRLILPQLVLIPILYFVQEVTIRLGLVTKKGHGELIREHFGLKWALLSVLTLFLASVGALVTEFSGIAGVSELFGIPGWISVSFATILLIVIGFSGSYRRIERIGIAFGLFQLFFFVAMFMAHPSLSDMAHGMISIPLQNRNYLFLLAANVGAVIMPWMVFYQQGAVIDKGLGTEHLKAARQDTILGSIVTQLVMVAVVVATAATIGHYSHRSLNDIQQIAQAITPFLGQFGGKVVFGLGMVGASFIAALVVSIAGAWGIGEAFGFNHSLNHKFKEAKWFYLIYTSAHVGGAILVILSVNLISLNVDVQVMNAMLLPIVLGFLLVLEAKALPKKWRMKGLHKYAVWLLSAIVMAFGLYMAVSIL